jgi:hypothetical protein
VLRLGIGKLDVKTNLHSHHDSDLLGLNMEIWGCIFMEGSMLCVLDFGR